MKQTNSYLKYTTHIKKNKKKIKKINFYTIGLFGFFRPEPAFANRPHCIPFGVPRTSAITTACFMGGRRLR